MSNVIKNSVDIFRKPARLINKLNPVDQIFGSKTAVGQILDPFQKQRANFAAGGSNNIGDVLDPNDKLHKQPINTKANDNLNAAAGAAEQAARIQAMTPSAPTFGQAQKSSQTSEDFLRRRRGVLANMVNSSYAGNTSGKTALGQ